MQKIIFLNLAALLIIVFLGLPIGAWLFNISSTILSVIGMVVILGCLFGLISCIYNIIIQLNKETTN